MELPRIYVEIRTRKREIDATKDKGKVRSGIETGQAIQKVQGRRVRDMK